MKRGNTGAAVRRLQQNLNICYDGADIAVNGIFGLQTRAALRRTQQAEGITPDGVYGPKTRDSIPWWAGGGGCWRVNGPGGN
jgi:peptidoglycan hydrolase-like protein with peptidoglycan-binding domain